MDKRMAVVLCGMVLVGIPGEQFVETGLRIKAAVRQHGLIPIVVAHAPALAYVPTPEAFAEGLKHDYEVDWARGMGMAPDAADRELKAVRRGLRRSESDSMRKRLLALDLDGTILDPYGRVLAQTCEADDCMLVAELDASLRDNCTGVRWIKTRRPELYGELAVPTGLEEDIRSVRFPDESPGETK